MHVFGLAQPFCGSPFSRPFHFTEAASSYRSQLFGKRRVQKNERNVRPLSRTGEGGPATDKMLLDAIMQPLSRIGEGGPAACERRKAVCGRRKAVYGRRKAVYGRRKAVCGRRRRHRTGRFSPARKQLPSNRRRRRPRRRRTGFYASPRRPRRDRRSARRAGRCRWIHSWCRGPRGR